MSHLGDRVAALVDGQLAPDANVRAQTHLGGCPPCRELVEIERLTKSRLATLGAPQPGDELLTRLYLLAGPDGPLPPREGRVPGTPRVRPVPMPPAPGRLPTGPVRPGRAATARPGTRRPLRNPLPSSPRVRMAAAAAVVGALSLIGAGVVGVSGGSAGRPAAPAEIAITPSGDPLTVPVWRGTDRVDR